MSRRLKAYGVSFELVIDMMRQDWEITDGIRNVDGVPADAVYLWCFPDEQNKDVYYVFEHPSFGEVPLGGVIPRSSVTHVRTVKAPEEREVFSSEQLRRGLP